MTQRRPGVIQFRAFILSLGMLAAAVCFSPTPSHAIPVSGEYVIDPNSLLSGSFTSDGAQLTAWNFNSGGVAWEDQSLGPLIHQNNEHAFITTILTDVRGAIHTYEQIWIIWGEQLTPPV